MNMEFFMIINNFAYKNALLDKVMIFFSNDVPYIFMAVIVLIFILGIINNKKENRKIAVNTVVITAINLIINLMIRIIFHINRPFVDHNVNLLVSHDTASSFPSNHATGTMSIAVALNKYNKVLGLIMTILSIIVGFSRVYVGDHYPIDIIGSYIIVFITNYVYNLVLRNKIEELYMNIEKFILGKYEKNKLKAY